MKVSLWISVFLLLLSFNLTHAGSATWNLTPKSGGWNTAASWTPGTVTWKFTNSMHSARDGHTATLLPDGEVLVVAGGNATGSHQSA